MFGEYIVIYSSIYLYSIALWWWGVGCKAKEIGYDAAEKKQNKTKQKLDDFHIERDKMKDVIVRIDIAILSAVKVNKE